MCAHIVFLYLSVFLWSEVGQVAGYTTDVYTCGQGSAAHLEIASTLLLDPLLIYILYCSGRWNVVERNELWIKQGGGTLWNEMSCG